MTKTVSIRMANVLALAVLGTHPFAAGAVPPGTPAPSDPVFRALLTDGTTVSGRIRQFGPSGEVALLPSERPERVITLKSLVKLTRDSSTSLFSPEGSLILLPEGDRLYRTVLGAATETMLEVQSYSLGNVAIPLESLLGLVLTRPADPGEFDALLWRVRTEPRTSEVVWLANGDRLTGGFLGLTDKQVKFQAANGQIALDRPGIVALGFDPGLAIYPKPEGDFLELTMADGSRLGVTNPRIEQGQVVASTRFGATIRLALGELVRVNARTASVSYLSDREATASQYVGYVGPTRPYRRDTTVDGHPLRLAGQTYDRGLGCQSRTLLAYRLATGDRRFQALVGLDDGAGPLGSVVFRVLIDGRERYASPPMSVRDVPQFIDIDVAGAKSLILATEFGERGEVRDHADWVEARLIR